MDQKLLIRESAGRGTMYCLPSALIADIVGGDWQASSGGLGSSPSPSHPEQAYLHYDT